MIATLRWWLVRVPARLIRHGRRLALRLPPGQYLLAEILARLRALPAPPMGGPVELVEVMPVALAGSLLPVPSVSRSSEAGSDRETLT